MTMNSSAVQEGVPSVRESQESDPRQLVQNAIECLERTLEAFDGWSKEHNNPALLPREQETPKPGLQELQHRFGPLISLGTGKPVTIAYSGETGHRIRSKPAGSERSDAGG